jgi:SAM-dependent methyltransferase
MKFEWPEAHQSEASCPVCAGSTAVHVLNAEQAGTEHHFVRCLACRSVYPLNFEDTGDLGGYTVGRAENDMGLKHYVEIGAGIDSLIAPLLSVVPEPRGSLLDVGCGFGFLPSMWDRFSGDTVAHGVELASYGHWGREILNAPISHALLSENDEVRSRQFDFVWSGEVIEHVPDPVQFIRNLKGVLKSDGVLILSTPDADSVNPATSPADLAAALSLGAHRFLMSEQSLRKLLNDAGFGFVVAGNSGTTMIMWASRNNVDVIPNTSERANQFTEGYLADIARCDNLWLRGGALYRLFRRIVNSGRWNEAEEIERQLAAVIEVSWGPASSWPTRVFELVGTDGLKPDQFIAAAPAYLGPFFHYRGLLNLAGRSRYLEAASDFDMALRLNTHAAQNYLAFAQEAGRLIASCVFHRQLALSYANRDTRHFKEVARQFDPLGSGHFEPRYEREVTWTE